MPKASRKAKTKAKSSPPTTAARAFLDTTVEHARAENKTAYNKADAAHDFWDHCVGAAIDDPRQDPANVQYSAIDEIAVALNMSRRNADVLIKVGGELHHRYPAVKTAFADGTLDYARVATIISVFADACTATVDAAQPRLVPLAQRYTPGPLRDALWRLWFSINRDEAKRARDQNIRCSRTTYVRSGGNGTAWLTACISDLEGAEAQRLIDDIADTVCPADPRSVNARRADGLMALLHGESVLPCRCGDDNCAMAGVEAPQRRKYLIQILIDIKTLLGLTNTPAVLDDGTPLPADVARILAADGQWQAILTDLSRLLPSAGDASPLGPIGRGRVHKAGTVPEPTLVPDPAGEPDPVAESDPVVDAESTAEAEPTADPEPAVAPEVADSSEPAPAAEPTPPMECAAPEPEAEPKPEPQPATPTVAQTTAPRPLGDPHTYRPTAALVALVRAMYPTCTFPGCCVRSSKCEIDHITAYNHDDPTLGGLTVLGNLQPVCKGHHQLKTKGLWTCRRTKRGVVWTSPTGLQRVTLAQNLPANLDTNRDTEMHKRFGFGGLHPDDLDAELDHPSWWDDVVGPDVPGPTLKDIATAHDPTTKATLKVLRRRYLEHRQIVQRKDDLLPPPF